MQYMQTREEAITKLERATQILHDAEALQAEIESTRASSSLQNAAAPKKKLKHTNLFEVGAFWLGSLIFLSPIIKLVLSIIVNWVDKLLILLGLRISMGFWDDFIAIAGFLLAIFPALFICKFVNKSRDKQNADTHARTAVAREQIELIQRDREALLGRLQQILDVYDQEVRPWLPDEYSSSSTTLTLLRFLQSGRADSLKEAMNLYEEIEHRRRMEEGQQRMEKNQGKIIRGQGLQALAMAASVIALQSDIAQTRNAIESLRPLPDPYAKWNQ